MDLRLVKHEYSLFETAIDTRLWTEQTADAVVPDSMPDILRIVDTSALVEVNEKELRGNKVIVAGEIKANVVFVPESGGGVRVIPVTLPFRETLDWGDAGNLAASAVAFVRVCSKRVDARELNPRKIAVKATVGFTLTVLVPKTLSLPAGLEGDVECETLSLPFASRVIVSVRDKAIAISDTVDADDELAADRVIKTELDVAVNDYKVIPNKVVVKAVAKLKLTGMTDDPVRPVKLREYELPFSAVIDCDGVNEDADCDLRFALTSCRWSITDSGERRGISVAIGLDAQVMAYITVQGEILADAYSITHDVALERETVDIPRENEAKSVRAQVREVIDPGMAPTKIYAVTVNPSQPVMMRDGSNAVGCDCEVRVVFETDDGGIYAVTRNLTASAELPASDEGYNFTAAEVSDADGHIDMAGGIEVRFTAVMSGELHADESREVLSGVTALDKKAATPNRPSITLRYAMPGESFWAIAKAYNTTVDDIRRSNEIEHESSPTAGKILLIPRR